MQRLDRQAVVDEILRQVIEQFRVGGPLAVQPEVAWRVHQAGAEVFLPHAVDDHPERNGLRRDAAGKLKSSATFRERDPFGAQHRQKSAGHRVAEPGRVAAQVHLQVDGLLDVTHAVHVGELGRQRLRHGLDVLAQPLDQGAAVAAESLLQSPPSKAQQARSRRLARRIVRVEVALKDIAPQRRALGGHAAQLEAAAWAEVVVGDELVRQVGRLLGFGGRQRARLDDVVLFLDLALFEHRADQQLLESVGERGRLFGGPAFRHHGLPVFEERIEHRTFLQERQPAVEQFVVELLLVDDGELVFLRLAGHLPGGLHVLR